MERFEEMPDAFIECKASAACCDTVAGLMNPTANLIVHVALAGDKLKVEYTANHQCGIKRHSIKIVLKDPANGRRWETNHHFEFNPPMVDPLVVLNWGPGPIAVNPLPENLIGKIVTVRLHVISDCRTSVIKEQAVGLF